MGTLIRQNGERLEVKPKGKYWTIEEIKEYIGDCYVEAVTLPNFVVLVDEDGIAKNLSMNVDATVKTHGLVNGPILGNCLFAEHTEMDYEG